MSDAPTLWKFFRADGRTLHGRASWPLPVDGKPGEWLPAIEGPLVACENGYHACREEDLVYWLGDRLWEIEARGEVLVADNKVALRQARLIRSVDTWNKRTQRLFAADCAERVLPLFEARFPSDMRPRKAIETARAYADGRATMKELVEAAAESASWAAEAWAAASWAAGWSAEAARAAGERAAEAAAAAGAAEAAAAGAARAAGERAAEAVRAAGASGWAAKRSAERAWQTKRLMEILYPIAQVEAKP